VTRSRSVLTLAVLLLASCGADVDTNTSSEAGAPQPRPFNVAGTLLVKNGDGTSGDGCQGLKSLGHGDLSSGTPVTITDGSGTKLASGLLGPGTFVDVMTGAAAKDATVMCAFPFMVKGIRGGSADYAIGIARRSGPAFSKRQADSLKLLVSGPGKVKMAPSRYRLGPNS
jgi:hypothetical protein